MAIIYGKNENQPKKISVLEKLSQLNDDYTVLCDLNIALLDYAKYDGKKDLGSAQMDFVVISKKGIVQIQAKDWNETPDQMTPHEQADRAGRVLWLYLKPSHTQNLHVTSVLVSDQDVKNDPKYKFVLVSDLKKINRLIQSGRANFSQRDVKRIVGQLKDYVTR